MDEILELVTAAAASHYHRTQRSLVRQRTGLYKVSDFQFDLSLFNKESCLHLFRFEHRHIQTVCRILFPLTHIVLDNRGKVPATEAVCILLHRLAYPNRLECMERVFARHFSIISRVITTTGDLLLESFGHLLSLSSSYASYERIEVWMNAVKSAGAPLNRCYGFVDGTVRPICRPSQFQKQAYNGHKRVHALKFQSVSAPDGIIVDLTGPWEGRRHDCGMLRESGLLGRLENIRTALGDATIYGDPAYPISPVLQVPFKGACVSESQQEWNSKMSRVRVSVEWCFGKVLVLFPFIDFKKNLKIYLQPVGKLYRIAVLFANIHTCVYGSVTSEFFGVQPASLEVYLSS
jgi:nuclease HARBI1